MKFTNEQLKTARIGVIGTRRDKDGILVRFTSAVYLDGVTGANTTAEQFGGKQNDFTTRHYAVVDAVNVAFALGMKITPDVRRDYAAALRFVRDDLKTQAEKALERAKDKAAAANNALTRSDEDAALRLKRIAE